MDTTKVLTRSEVAQVLSDLDRRAARSVSSRQNRALFRLSTCCGLRVSEIASLRLSDLRENGGTKPHLHLRKATTKGRKSRTVPLWWDR